MKELKNLNIENLKKDFIINDEILRVLNINSQINSFNKRLESVQKTVKELNQEKFNNAYSLGEMFHPIFEATRNIRAKEKGSKAKLWSEVVVQMGSSTSTSNAYINFYLAVENCRKLSKSKLNNDGSSVEENVFLSALIINKQVDKDGNMLEFLESRNFTFKVMKEFIKKFKSSEKKEKDHHKRAAALVNSLKKEVKGLDTELSTTLENNIFDVLEDEEITEKEKEARIAKMRIEAIDQVDMLHLDIEKVGNHFAKITREAIKEGKKTPSFNDARKAFLKIQREKQATADAKEERRKLAEIEKAEKAFSGEKQGKVDHKDVVAFVEGSNDVDFLLNLQNIISIKLDELQSDQADHTDIERMEENLQKSLV